MENLGADKKLILIWALNKWDGGMEWINLASVWLL
jgi:hypothetical protein